MKLVSKTGPLSTRIAGLWQSIKDQSQPNMCYPFLAQPGVGKASVSFSKPKPSQSKTEAESVPIFQQSAIGK